jgi:hypothetical protein
LGTLGSYFQIGKMANLPDFLMKYRILKTVNHRSLDKINKHPRSKIISIIGAILAFRFWRKRFVLYFSKIGCVKNGI